MSALVRGGIEITIVFGQQMKHGRRCEAAGGRGWRSMKDMVAKRQSDALPPSWRESPQFFNRQCAFGLRDTGAQGSGDIAAIKIAGTLNSQFRQY